MVPVNKICFDCDNKIRIREDGTICIKPECGPACRGCRCCADCPRELCLTVTAPNSGECACIGTFGLDLEQQEFFDDEFNLYWSCEWWNLEIESTGCPPGHAFHVPEGILVCNADTCQWELSVGLGTFGLPPYAQIALFGTKPFCKCPPLGEWEMSVDIDVQVGQPDINCTGEWTVVLSEGAC